MAERFVAKKYTAGRNKGKFIITISKGNSYPSKYTNDVYNITDISTREDGEPLQVFFLRNNKQESAMNYYDFMVDIMGGNDKVSELFDYYDPYKTSEDTQSTNTPAQTTDGGGKKRNAIIAIAIIAASIVTFAAIARKQ